MTPRTNELMTVIGVLWCERRISYERLRDDYGIDEKTLEFIRVELVNVKGIAKDVDGLGLAWIGDDQLAPAVTDARAQAGPIPAPDDAAERRQLTVMFCDLVGSTKLATRLDPEDLRDVLQKFRDHCEAVIVEHGGTVAAYLGDGVMVHFGYPRAHEDDAVRAVQAGLKIANTMPELNEDLGIGGVELAVRIGIATGPVIIGKATPDGVPGESSVVGETPSLAARLQGTAQPNEVVLNEVSKRLVSGRIEVRDLGVRSLKGLPEPVRVWRALGEFDILRGFDDHAFVANLPLVGRQEELNLLHRAWDASRSHGGQVAFIRGEAGIGKTRLLRALRRYTGEDAKWITFRGSADQRSTALHPVLTHLKKVLALAQLDGGQSALDTLESLIADCKQINLPEAMPLLAGLLSIPLDGSRYPPLDLTSDQRREAVLDTLVEWLAWEAEKAPVVLAWEDVHWSDPTTILMMELLIEQIPSVPMLMVGTYRSEFDLPFSQRSYGTSISINRLQRPEVEQIVRQVAGGKTLPDEVLTHIIEKSDGVPLFVEELTRTILESDALTETENGYDLNVGLVGTQIPNTLQDSLMARLDRAPQVRRIAQVGAVLGREFSYDLLLAVAAMEGENLEDALRHLIKNDILIQRGRPPRSRYFFKHALIQDAAYQCLLRRDRRNVHSRVAEVLEADFPDLVADAPELIGHHLNEAGSFAKAADNWQLAGERAGEQSAYLEAIDHFRRALGALEQLDETPERITREVKVNFLLGAAYFMTKGHGAAEVENAYSRARELSAQIEDAPDMFPVLSGLWRCFVMRPELETACDLGEQLVRVAERDQSAEELVVAHCAAGINAFYVGDFAGCVDYTDKSRAGYELSQRSAIMFRAGTDPAVMDCAYSSWALWLLGRPDESVTRALEMKDHARLTEHPFSMAAADSYAAVTFQMMRDQSRAKSYAESGIALSEKRGFKFWWAYATVQRGWALTREGRLSEGIATMREGIAAQLTGGAAIKVPFWMGLLAEALLAEGQAEEALAISDEALEMMVKTGDRFAEAELLRIKGEILMAESNDPARVLATFERSLAVAGEQKARSWELRTALSLARHWQKGGRGERARDLLAPLVETIIGGHATHDLRAARDFLTRETA